MIIYVVIRDSDDGCSQVIGVFSTQEKARAAARETDDIIVAELDR